MNAASARPDIGSDHLDSVNFARLSAFIRDASGIKMPESKRTMLEGRLRRRVRATESGTIAQYCDWFFEAGATREDEVVHLINAVTTNKTDFFREPSHFDYLAATVLPALHASGRRRIRAWSAACSTGAEPYTMAMVMDAFAAKHGGPEYGILATDLDTEVLDMARRGVFATELVAPVPPILRQRYVMSPRANGRGEIRMATDLRSAIGFARLNLMDAHYPVGEPMDIIFCRNVLIYFDKPTQEKVVQRLAACLRPGGHLFLGHSETVTGFDLPLTTVANTVFQRNADA